MYHKAADTAAKMDKLVPVTINGVTKMRIEHFLGFLPKYARHLRKWGEAGVVKVKTATRPKLEDKGTTCMFVGYPNNHPGDTYELLNWKTKRITVTRDVIWLN